MNFFDEHQSEVQDFAGKIDGSGAKFGFRDKKNRLSLVPPLFVKILGWVFTYGAKKYADNNWLKGIQWSEVYEASYRHLLDFWDNMDIDEESRLDHLAHAFWGMGVLLYYGMHKEYKKFDDRVFSEGERGTEKVVGTTRLELTEPEHPIEYSNAPQFHASMLMMQDEVPTAPDLVDALLSGYPELRSYMVEAAAEEGTSKVRTYAWEMIQSRVRKEIENAKEAGRLAEDVDSCEERDRAPSYVPPVVRPECDSGGCTP